MGGTGIAERLTQRCGARLGESTADGRFTLLPIVCLGACDHAPVMMVDDDLHLDLEPAKVGKHSRPVQVAMETPLTKNIRATGAPRSKSLRGAGGYQALRKVLRSMTPAEVIEEVKTFEPAEAAAAQASRRE